MDKINFIQASLLTLTLALAPACSKAPEAINAPGASQTDGRLAARAARVEIIRDDYGVPHIYAKTDADAIFGMLYAQAEDDFARIERNYIWATGRLAEVAGEGALYSDLRARLYMSTDEAKAAYAASPEWLKDLCDAYADGLNYYLETHPEVTPALLTRFEPWMPMFFSEGSIGGDIEQIPLGGIAAFYGDGTPKNAPRRIADTSEPGGSNGIAIAGQHTASGDAMLLINPHTSFYFRGEIHVVSEEGLNAYGAVTWGQFFVYQGFNETTGWMHTSTYADFIDEFVEDVFAQDGALYYTYGNEKREVEVSEVTLKYSDGAGGMAARTFPIYRTHHGPVTHMQDGKWVVTRINWDPVNALQQSFIRTKLADHDAFWDMMDIRTNSSNNTVFADSSGNIAYYHGNFMPRRDTRFDYSKPVDGSDPATDWKGLHEVEEIITVVNPAGGWIQNANSTPFTSAGADSPRRENYPAYMAPDAENFRAVHAIDLLEKLDSQGAQKLTLDGLIELAYDPYLPGMQVMVDGLSAAYDALGASRADIGEAIKVLEDWDRRVSIDSIAMSVGHFYAVNLSEAAGQYSDLSQMERLIYMSQKADPGLRLDVLAQTLEQMNADFGTWQTPWGEINRFQRLTGDIDLPFDDAKPSIPVGMASGNWGALAAFGASAAPNTKRIYGYRGNSFVAVVEFGDRVMAKTLLAGGQSGDPASPHFNDQSQRYADRLFKTVPFYREDVEARARRTYKPGDD